ncbi:hypothetical protein IWQ56_001078 [Coemansia nantahalensis]|uniref:Uncharacterized protein n=2 Tax=Coemansia TaxID=4863 RepID=A0ACC1LEX0_9FUNG|nr:hypothetical protein IWQ57_006134 [Coemansia nantahalensis]KAJ2773212.1 hypothetical protein IWQ56_001078 [Coemansia nantahalensis]KAJ2807096.1 hypothetical protein H4R21_000619 [Coemansia helicoidea]
MGQAGSKAATRMRLPRTPATGAPAEGAQSAPRKMATREEMLAEEDGKDDTLQDNIKYFLDPKELLTPITPAHPEENANYRALTNRRAGAGAGATAKSTEIAQMLRELQGTPAAREAEAVARAAATYGLDPATVRKLSRFLSPGPGA